MSPALVFAFSLASMCDLGPGVPVPFRVTVPLQQAGYEELYKSGLTFSDFLEEAEDQHEEWLENYARDYVALEMRPQAREISGNWRLLVVGEDWCSDSVNTIPYLAKLTEGVNGLDMRIVNSKEGRWVMEATRRRTAGLRRPPLSFSTTTVRRWDAGVSVPPFFRIGG